MYLFYISWYAISYAKAYTCISNVSFLFSRNLLEDNILCFSETEILSYNNMSDSFNLLSFSMLQNIFTPYWVVFTICIVNEVVLIIFAVLINEYLRLLILIKATYIHSVKMTASETSSKTWEIVAAKLFLSVWHI